MPWWLWIAIVGGAVVVVAVVVWRALVARRSAVLRERFGPEYDRTVKSAGGRRKAEAKLVERQERRETLQIIAVTADAKQRYLAEWEIVQARFLEAPVPAMAAADALVVSVMADQGYPMLVGSEQRFADASVDHPEAVGEGRQAHEVYRRCDQGKATTEDLRRAMQHYGAFLASLLKQDEGAVVKGEQGDEPAPGTDTAASEAQVDHN